MQSTELTRGRTRRLAFDGWPSMNWWPEPAGDLVRPGWSGASATFVLPPRTESVQTARAFATDTLANWRMPRLLDSMQVVVSELATNALRHGLALTAPRHGHTVRLALIRRGELVTCAIADPASAAPIPRTPAPLEPGGLGLHIVESLSLRWGWCPLLPWGKAVWAVLSA